MDASRFFDDPFFSTLLEIKSGLTSARRLAIGSVKSRLDVADTHIADLLKTETCRPHEVESAKPRQKAHMPLLKLSTRAQGTRTLLEVLNDLEGKMVTAQRVMPKVLGYPTKLVLAEHNIVTALREISQRQAPVDRSTNAVAMSKPGRF